MSAHTAGNWRVEFRPDSADSDRPLVVAGTELICAVSRLGGNRRESEVNARLIAAAPELLVVAECEEALAAIRSPVGKLSDIETLERHGFDRNGSEPAYVFVSRLRRAAIAKTKATGATL